MKKIPRKSALIHIRSVKDDRGTLSLIEHAELPFDIKRLFWIYGVPKSETRGGHAHKTCHELVICASGSFTVTTYDGTNRHIYPLSVGTEALLIPAGVWCDLHNFSESSVCVVAASEDYDVTGYINDLESYKAYCDQCDKV